MSYPFTQAQHSFQHGYKDSTSGFQPYAQSAPQPHASYEEDPQAAYRDEGPSQQGSQFPGVNRNNSIREKDEVDPWQAPPKSTGDLRMWRHDHHGNLWFKGSRVRCIGRFCCCTTMITIVMFISIVLTLAIFLRPPDIEFGGIAPMATGSTVEATTDDLKVNLGIKILVKNPNFFTVTFKSITAAISYPINNVRIGGGQQDNIVFKSNSETSFTFPFTLDYSESADPNGTVLQDIANRCGFIPGSTKRQLAINYNLKLAIQILGITISPPISGTANFDCPFTLNDIKPLLGSIPSLSGLLNGRTPDTII
ncbi:hypothetical protein BU17DRAFT_71325 [Hysterangium stoloniferum]|nr:hypothetical protein BU17DRAFT_71325 [Hysterangium stoloniferum]